MAFFYRFQTYNLILHLTQRNILKDATKVIVSLAQNKTIKTYNDAIIDTENDSVTVVLSQQDTAEFRVGSVKVQVNIYYAKNKVRVVSAQGVLYVKENLLEEVITE